MQNEQSTDKGLPKFRTKLADLEAKTRGRSITDTDYFQMRALCLELAEVSDGLAAELSRLQSERDEEKAWRERLQQHALKYVDPLLGSDNVAKDAEDWIENRLARHGEGHHALTGIYPCDMGMLANHLKSARLRLYKAESELAEEKAAREPMILDLAMTVRRLCRALRRAVPDHKMPTQAMDFLTRKGLQGSVLRATGSGQDTPVATSSEPNQQSAVLADKQPERVDE